MYEFQTIYKDYEISSNYLGNKNWHWNTELGKCVDNYNNHRITVKNIKTGKNTWFEFWENNIDAIIKSETQLMNAFYCFLTDATAGKLDYFDFCNEFGYNAYDGNTKRIYSACVRQREKASKILTDNIYDLINEITERWGF